MRALILLLVALPAFGAYGHSRTITIDHTKVPNTDQSYFPVLVSGTYSYLATVANGGLVQNVDGSSNATDLVFTSDANCSILLPFEIETYTATSGLINYWVRVPLVSHTVDTVFYLCYGNSAVTTQQAQTRAVWANGFTMVMHMAGNNTDSMSDGYWEDHPGTDTSVTYNTSNGKIGQGAGYNGTSSQYVNSTRMGTNTAITTGLTMSAWIKWSSGNVTSSVVSNETANNGYQLQLAGTSGACTPANTAGSIYAAAPAVSCNLAGGGYAMTSGVFAYIALARSGSTWTLYANGVAQSTGTVDPNPPGNGFLVGSANGSQFFGGAVDEVRMAKMPRSADWLLTEYNNQSSPSTFYTVGSDVAPSPFGFTFNRTVTIDHTKVPTADQTNFPVLLSGTYSYLATVANSGNVQNASGFDIVFANDSSCTNGYLPFEVESYSATDGTVNIWIDIPSLSHTVDTVFYMCYGNASVSSSLSNVGLTWNSHYKGVWHYAGSLSLSDSTIYVTTLSNHGATATTGGVDGTAAVVQASTQYLDAGNAYPVNLSGCSAGSSCGYLYTTEAWVNFTGTFTNGVNPEIIGNENAATSRGYRSFVSANDSGICANCGACQFWNGGLVTTYSGVALTKNAFHYLNCMTTSTGVNEVCQDGSCVTNGSQTGVADDGQTGTNIGRYGAAATNTYWDGKLDEIRISDVNWSTALISALYNTISSPSTFYQVGAQVGSAGIHHKSSLQ